MIIITMNTSDTKIGIHIGLSTHTHDQVILPNNFSTMNTIVNIPQNPIPAELLLDGLLLILSSFIIRNVENLKIDPPRYQLIF